MRLTHATLPLLTVLIVAGCGGDPAGSIPGTGDGTTSVVRSAVIATFTNPFAGSGVTAIAGRVSSDGHSWLVFWRTTDATCQWHKLGAPAIADSVTISVENAAFAEVQILAPFQSKGVFCSNFNNTWTFNGAVAQGDFQIGVRGSPGADFFNCTGGGDTFCDGGGGNDIMDSLDAVTELRGGFGDDKLRFFVPTGRHSLLFGGPGADCLQLSSTPTLINTYDCGPDADRSTHILGANCEFLVSPGSCN